MRPCVRACVRAYRIQDTDNRILYYLILEKFKFKCGVHASLAIIKHNIKRVRACVRVCVFVCVVYVMLVRISVVLMFPLFIMCACTFFLNFVHHYIVLVFEV